MFWRKTTITRPDRDRLIETTGAKANALGWAIFIDELQREIARVGVVEPVPHRDYSLKDADRGPGKLQSKLYTLAYPEGGFRRRETLGAVVNINRPAWRS